MHCCQWHLSLAPADQPSAQADAACSGQLTMMQSCPLKGLKLVSNALQMGLSGCSGAAKRLSCRHSACRPVQIVACLRCITLGPSGPAWFHLIITGCQGCQGHRAALRHGRDPVLGLPGELRWFGASNLNGTGNHVDLSEAPALLLLPAGHLPPLHLPLLPSRRHAGAGGIPSAGANGA